MKKLMIALAAAATAMFSFGAGTDTAENRETLVTGATGTSFEALTEGPVSVSNIVNRSDAGSPTGDFYWSSTATADAELGAITNDVADASLNLGRPDMFLNETQGKSLFIDTTAPLVRTALPNNSGVSPVDIGDGIYLDTLVKFTAAEDAFTDNLTGGDKIAIEYVEREAEYTNGVDQVTGEPTNLVAVAAMTNFVIRAGLIGEELGQTNYYAYVSGDPDFTNFDKDAWHRLTVRTIADVGDGNVGFVIYLDGDMTKTLEYSKDVDAGFGTLNALAQTFYNSEKHALFPSAVAAEDIGGSTISSVAFSGNGFIDDVSFTATKPTFINEAIRVTIAWDEHVTGMTINGTVLTAEQVAEMSWTGEPNNGAVIAIPTFDTGYVAGAPVLPEGATYDSETKTFGNLTSGMTCTIKSMFPLYEVNGVSFDDLDAALTAAAAGTAQSPATLKLLADCNKALSFTGGYIILDLAGHDLQATSVEDVFTIANMGANLAITNSGAEASVKMSTSPDAAGLIYLSEEAGFTTLQAGTYEGYIYCAIQNTEKEPADMLSITGGKFLDQMYDESDPQPFYLVSCVAAGLETTYLGSNYFQVGESGGGDTPTEIDVPTAASNLVYDGTEQTGVAAGTGYTLTGVTAATNAGEYTATATLEEGYVWSDTTTEAKSINWSIAAKTDATVVVALTADIAEYTAQLEFPTATATIGDAAVAGNTAWDPATISEPEAGATNTYTVTFTVTTANYAGSTGTATFKVWKAAAGKTYPSYITDATAQGKYDEWATANNISASDFPDTGNAYQDAYLLNIAPDAADKTLKPTAITISGSTVTITANQDLTSVNGKVYIKTAGTLAGLESALWGEATVDDTTGAIEMTSNGTAAFFKIKVDFAANNPEP